MGASSAISWTDATWNPATGCRKISPGCKFCYMFREKRRYGQDPEVIARTSPATFDAPLKRDRTGAYKWADGTDVFTASWSDVFLEELDGFRDDLWRVIRERPGLRFFVLTKRADRVAANLPPDWGDGYPNVILGVSVESGAYMDRVRDVLAVPAVGRMISAEPLLGTLRVDGAGSLLRRLDWIVSGGESGPGARPSHPAWFRELRDLALDAGVPFHHKQWGEWAPGFHFPDHIPASESTGDMWAAEIPEDRRMWRVGRDIAGRLLDGVEHNDRPRVGMTAAYLAGRA